MSQRKDIPPYRRQKNKDRPDRAFVLLDGRRHYLGRYDSRESRRRYDQLIAEWLAHNRTLPAFSEALTVNDLISRFERWADDHYRRIDGSLTNEPHNIRIASKALAELYGHADAREFGPTQLRAVQQRMIARGWTRSFVNKSIGRIRRLFRWAVGRELVPIDVLEALRAVEGLRPGRSAARESGPVRPVSDDIVNATIPHLTPTLQAMVRLQMLTGMRPGEVCAMCASDIDTSTDLWEYRPKHHKMAHAGRERIVLLGPQAQDILKPYLTHALSAPIFSPRQSERERRAAQHASRCTPLSCGNAPGRNRKRHPQRTPGDRYDAMSYGKAIKAACEAAFPPPPPLGRHPDETQAAWRARLTEQQAALLQEWKKSHHWTPNQLRHAFATRIRGQYGLEPTQALMGHAKADITQIYADRDLDGARRVAREVG